MEKYSKLTIVIHWVSALLIIGMIVTGMAMEDAPASANKVWNLQIHFTLGIFVALLSAFRVILYMLEQKRKIYPKALDTGNKIKNTVQKITHLFLRQLLMGLSITGFLALFLSGLFPVVMSGKVEAFEAYQSGNVNIAHAILSKVYMLLFIIHLAGIVQYIWLSKQNIFKRIW